MTDTIAACASGAGRAGVAVVRVSGPLVPDIIKKIINKDLQPRFATHAKFYDVNQDVIDIGLALFFPAPHSFTGEHVLELQGHGGPVVIDNLLEAIIACGARVARPGEFSERAFLNNKIDLTQAEAIADLIDSASQAAARSALRSLQGEFANKIESLKLAIIQLRVQVEAMIDFPDEDIDTVASDNILKHAEDIKERIEIITNQATQGALLRDGISVVIIGQPNVGKSTLLNQLSAKQSAIVTDIPGTTRDVMRERILLDDLPLHIIDTAGLRDSPDEVEQEGIRRAWLEVSQADHVLYLFDVRHPPSAMELAEVKEKMPAVQLTLVANKIDLLSNDSQRELINEEPLLLISAMTGDGMLEFKRYLQASVGYQNNQENNFIARRRHLQALRQAVEFVTQAATQLQAKQALECVAEDFRLAHNALCEITGEYSSDDLLGEIFSSFCIGK